MKCISCKKRIGLFEHKCNSCNKIYCLRCRLPEDHKCDGLEANKKDKLKELAAKLHKEATHDNHHMFSI